MSSIGRTRREEENLYLLVEILDVLRIAIDAYKEGHQSAWLIISARLHQLLTDKGNRQVPVAVRVIPKLQFHPMKQNLKNRQVDFIMASPVGIHSTENGVSLEIFDTAKLRIDLNDWLEQVAYIIDSNELTIKQLIEEPRHQAGGVHFDPVLRASTHRIEGILLYANIGEKQLSFRDYLHALGEYIQAEINAQTIAALGNGHRQEGNFEKATEFYESALKSFMEIDDLQGQSEQWNNKGYLAYLQGDLAIAKEYYQTAQKLNEQLGWGEAIVNVNNNLAIVCLELGNHFLKINPEKSVNEYLAVLKAGKANNDDVHQTIALTNLSDAYLSLGKYREAFSAVLIPLVMSYQIDDNLKSRIERKAKSMIKNLPDQFQEVVANLRNEQRESMLLAVGSETEFDNHSNDTFEKVIDKLINEK